VVILLMAIDYFLILVAILLVVIGCFSICSYFISDYDIVGYYIGGYWWLLVAIGGYWWLLMAILLMVIDSYFIGGY